MRRVVPGVLVAAAVALASIAIAAVETRLFGSPVIGADADDVASSIAFTAILGVIVVLELPLLVAPLHLTNYQYGVLAGSRVIAAVSLSLLLLVVLGIALIHLLSIR